MNKTALSKHRHISFTAHYTGYIWYQMGISHPALASTQGKFYAQLLHPLESIAERYVGSSIRRTLKTRHQMLDQRLQEMLEQDPELQVLEIAAGLSPRGWWFKQHYPNLTYFELDLPLMAQTKQHALNQMTADHPQVIAVDLFSTEFKHAFQHFDCTKNLVLISEGLINYFDKDLLQQLISSIAEYGKDFKRLHYLTDLYPEPTQHKLAKVIWNSSKLLKLMSRSAFSFHFINPKQVQSFFQLAGFSHVDVIQPSAADSQTSGASDQHLGDLVWMVSARR